MQKFLIILQSLKDKNKNLLIAKDFCEAQKIANSPFTIMRTKTIKYFHLDRYTHKKKTRNIKNKVKI